MLLCPWDFPGKNTAVGCHFRLQGSLPDPGIKLVSLVSSALACGSFATGKILYHLGSPQVPGLNASTSEPFADCFPRGSLSHFIPLVPTAPALTASRAGFTNLCAH